jgi:hypothetical protein
MSRQKTLAAAVALTTLFALPAASEAHCFSRVDAGLKRAAYGVGHVVHRLGDGVVRVGDRLVGWMFCGHHRV